MRPLPLLLAALCGCSAGSVVATPPGDVAMHVSDAVWWTVRDTGDPGTDGSVVVLVSSEGDLCHALTVNTFPRDQELFALEAFSGTSDHGPAKGSYPAGVSSGPHATGRRYSAAAGCAPPTAHAALQSGKLALDDAPAAGSTLHGTFEGALDDGTKVTVAFSASSCDAAAPNLSGLADDLRFRTCSQ